MKNLNKLLLALLLALFLSCSNDDGTDGSGIADVDLAGTVFDTPLKPKAESPMKLKMDFLYILPMW